MKLALLLLAGVHGMHGLPSFTASTSYSQTTNVSSMVQGYWAVDLSRFAPLAFPTLSASLVVRRRQTYVASAARSAVA
jgi:hypothetical protein